MNELQQLLQEIARLTAQIETEYPELYQYLDEDPITISPDDHPDIDKATMKEYLETLRSLLESHIQTHSKA